MDGSKDGSLNKWMNEWVGEWMSERKKLEIMHVRIIFRKRRWKERLLIRSALYMENLLIVLYYNVRLDCEKFIFSTQTGQNKKGLLSKLAAMPKTLNNSSNLISCKQVCKWNIICKVKMMYATEVPETILTNQAGDKMFPAKKELCALS